MPLIIPWKKWVFQHKDIYQRALVSEGIDPTLATKLSKALFALQQVQVRQEEENYLTIENSLTSLIDAEPVVVEDDRRKIFTAFIPGTLEDTFSFKIPLLIEEITSLAGWEIITAVATCMDEPSTVDATNYMKLVLDDGTTQREIRIDDTTAGAKHLIQTSLGAKVIYYEGGFNSSRSGDERFGIHFTATSDQSIGGMAVQLRYHDGGTPYTQDIELALYAEDQSTVLGSGTVENIANSYTWHQVTFAEPVSLVNGTSYWAKVRAKDGQGLNLQFNSGHTTMTGATFLGADDLTGYSFGTMTNARTYPYPFRIYGEGVNNFVDDITVTVTEVGTAGAGPGGDVLVVIYLEAIAA